MPRHQPLRISVVSYEMSTTKTPVVDGYFSRPDLNRVLSLVRPAALYGDQVALCSPAYMMSEMLSHAFGNMEGNPQGFLDLMKSLYPEIVNSPDMKSVYDAQRRFLRSTSQKVRAAARREMCEFVGAIARAKEGLSIAEANFDQDSLAEVNEGKRAGILRIDELDGFSPKNLGMVMSQMASIVSSSPGDVSPGSFGQISGLVGSLIRHIVETLNDPTSYPILDGTARQTIGAHVGNITSKTAGARSRHCGVADHVLGRLPLADVHILDIAEIRNELSEHLAPFRVAIADLSDEIAAAQWEPGFDEEVVHLYNEKIQPQVEELRGELDHISSSRFKAHQRRSVAMSTAKISGGLFVGMNAVAPLLDGWIGAALTGIASLPLSIAQFAYSMAKEVRDRAENERGKLIENKLYYFIAAEDMLGTSPKAR